MVAPINQLTSFTYTTYIQATPERVWQEKDDTFPANQRAVKRQSA